MNPLESPTGLPVVEVSFDTIAAEAQITALATTPGHAREVAGLRGLASQAGSLCLTLREKIGAAMNTLLKRQEAREAEISKAAELVVQLEGQENAVSLELDGAQVEYELACSKAGITTHSLDENLDAHIAAKMNARHGLSVNVASYIEQQGAPSPLDEQVLARFTDYKPTKGKQFSDWALRIVTGLLFGVGLLTLLGLVKERTITLQPEWLIIAIAIGATITSMAKLFVQKQAIAFFRRNFLKKKTDGLATATGIFAIAVVIMIVTVEALGIYSMFQQKASVAAAVSGGTTFSPPVFVLWAIALTSTGLLFGLAVSQAREEWEQEEAFLTEQAKVREEHSNMVAAWRELAAHIEAWAPSEPGIVEARQIAVTGRHQTAELHRLQSNLYDARKKLEELTTSPVKLLAHEEDDLKTCYKQANEAVQAYNEAIASFGTVPKATT